ncbi:MAG TPA: DUF2520 domain-containing protein [Acidimicrobiales bacterium]|nr:DUF2520 domain-containing protein [Acidimicrobiales bacterium]
MGSPSLRVIGPGRAGRALAAALSTSGWRLAGFLGRGDDPRDAARGVDLVVLATPDSAVADVAARIEPDAAAVVAHVSGSLPLSALDPHERRGSLHPLRAIPTADTPLAGAWFAVAGDPLVERAVADLGGRAVTVPEDARAGYHAAAVIASNHLVALLGQVERVAADAGVPLAAFFDLVRGTVDNVERLGPVDALTGPVARGDWLTVQRHLDALAPEERGAYRAMAALAERLVDEHHRHPSVEGDAA